MRERTITIPELMLVAGSRVVLGTGIGLLLAGKLGEQSRKSAGTALLTVGALTTIPLAVLFFKSSATKEKLPTERLT
jgi:hypothetical protein